MVKRIISLILSAVLVLVAPFSVFAANDYFYKDSIPNNRSTSDKWGFIIGECTSYVAWCLNSRNNIPFTNWYKQGANKTWGHAKDWGNAARNAGITVNTTPAVGSVGYTTSGDYGHVVYVVAVNGSQVTVEEYSGSTHLFRSYNNSVSVYAGFIHFENNTAPPLPTTSANIPNGTYTIKHRDTGKFMTMGMSKDDGYRTKLWDWTNQDEQRLYLERYSDNTYTIKSQYSGKYLTVSGASMQNNAAIQQWGYTNNNAEARWYIISISDGSFVFINKQSSLVIDTGSNDTGAGMIQFSYNGGGFQCFRIIPVNSVNISNGIYAIKHPGSGKYLTMGMSKDDGYRTKLWDWTNLDEQRLYFEQQSDNSYTIKSQYSGKYLTISGPSMSNAAAVHQWGNISGQSYARWYITSPANGVYSFINKYSGLAIDAVSNTNANGTGTIQYTYHGGDFQRFQLVLLAAVTYNANGGTGAPENQNKTLDTSITLSSTKPTRNGYIFKGWAASNTAVVSEYQPGESYTANAAVTLYAVWQKDETKPDYELSIIQNSLNWDGAKIQGTIQVNIVKNISAPQTGSIMVGIYDNTDKLISITMNDIQKLNAENNSSPVMNINIPNANASSYSAKIMLWNSASQMEPLCEPNIIPTLP